MYKVICNIKVRRSTKSASCAPNNKQQQNTEDKKKKEKEVIIPTYGHKAKRSKEISMQVLKVRLVLGCCCCCYLFIYYLIFFCFIFWALTPLHKSDIILFYCVFFIRTSTTNLEYKQNVFKK